MTDFWEPSYTAQLVNGLARRLALRSPQYQELQRQAALKRNQGQVGREALKPYIGKSLRPTGISNRLSSRIRYSKAKTGTYRGRPREDK